VVVRIGPNLSALLRGPHARFIAQLHAALTGAGFGDIPPAYYPVFWSLDRDGTRLTTLAERAQVTKQLMNYFVNLLVDMGYLQRVADPTDGRARLVQFTERGRALERAAEAAIADIENEWAGRLGPKKMRKLRSLLVRLDTALAERSPDAPTAGYK
jgi:DNA-binding MarR family transcriptional regulator